MAASTRPKNPAKKATNYPGVYTYDTKDGDVVFYIRYRRGGRNSKQTTEQVGKKSEGMSARKASMLRTMRIEDDGDGASDNMDNVGVPEANGYTKEETKEYTVDELWDVYSSAKTSVYWVTTAAKCIYKKHISGVLGKRTVRSLKTVDIDRLRDAVLATGKIATANHIVMLLRAMLHYGERTDLFVVPKSLILTKVKHDNTKTEVLTDGQLSRLLEEIANYEHKHIIAYMTLVLNTGIRRQAAISLKWSDYDRERRFLTLRGESAKSGKTNSIPINETVYDLLESWPKQYGEYIFPQHHRSNYTWHAKKIMRRAGIPEDFRPLHGLRHNFASRLASSGKVQLYTLQKLLTHSSGEMTQRYAHLANEALTAAVNVADDVLNINKPKK